MTNSDLNSDRPEIGTDSPPNTGIELEQQQQAQPWQGQQWQSEQKPMEPPRMETRYVYGAQPTPSEQAKPSRPKRTRLIVGIAAAVLSVAILFTTLTAVVVYNVVNRQQLMTTSQTTGTTPSPTTQQPATTQPGTQTQPSASADNSITDKHFSIADAATKQAAGKKALSIMQIAKAAKPAVVAISTESRVQNAFGQSGLVDAAGSGFIISANGYIVTNFHVIEGAQTISIAMNDGKTFTATIVGSDAHNDIAVLKINGQNLPIVVLGKSADLEVGELAVAIGNPLGELSGTVTAGIISALDRQVTIDGQSLSLLQTDAAINAGNSGGALINSFGEVIGINTAKNAGSGIEGLGFAIPIDIVKPIIESLIQFGYIQGRPKIGIGTRDVTAQMAKSYSIPKGVYVSSVEAGSAAEDAGLKVGDVIIKADGQEILTSEALDKVKTSHKVGDTMTIILVRETNEISVVLTLKEELPVAVGKASYSSSAGNII